MADRLAMPDFVARMRRLTEPVVDPSGVQAFLDAHLIDPDSLAPYLRFAPERYTRHLVFKSPAVELLVLCWPRGSRAPIHGHEGELCWARVERQLQKHQIKPCVELCADLPQMADPIEAKPLMQPDRCLIAGLDAGDHDMLAQRARARDQFAYESLAYPFAAPVLAHID